MNEKEKMLNGKIYNAQDKELVEARIRARHLTKKYNNSAPEDINFRTEILEELFGEVGENPWIEPPFTCDYGENIKWGNNSYANFDCLILDSAEVIIGNNVLIGPNVKIYTATHPISAKERLMGSEYAKPIKIGNNVWIGGGTLINPGVNIGDNSIIGSGSVVREDIPANVLALGNPCKVVKDIND